MTQEVYVIWSPKKVARYSVMKESKNVYTLEGVRGVPLIVLKQATTTDSQRIFYDIKTECVVCHSCEMSISASYASAFRIMKEHDLAFHIKEEDPT